MAKTPTAVRIRAYDVGFGDCFLLTFVYGTSDARYVLIDFGTTKTSRDSPLKSTKAIAQRIATDCGNKLHVLVATHRHQDHVSGFSDEADDGGPGKIIRDCKPDLVVQPWTEDPDIAIDALSSPKSLAPRHRFVARLANLHAVSAAALAASASTRLGTRVRGQLAFLGEDNLKNAAAVKNLIRMGKAGQAVYARYGTKLPTKTLLPGVKVEVLGPPDLTQSDSIRKQRTEDPSEFWHLAAKTLMPGARPALSNAPAGTVPARARWFARQLDRAQGESMLELVRALDEELNNTSLILLFTVRGKKLLFSGDAQLENWQYALQSKAHGAKNRTKLAGVDFYKVGHHGSLNATPRTLLWENFAKKSKSKDAPGRLTTVVSTAKGKHGHEDRGTEVPRKKLVAALDAETAFTSTEGLTKKDGGSLVVEIPLP